ncbi:MAG: hypothetical protein MK171_03370 [Pirellulales bacterium]|nr:hypothetical protein [Pirellulales bacterium]
MSPSTESLLTCLGWGTIVSCFALVIVPYLRGKKDLVTAWNCILCGVATNFGVGFLEAVDRTALVYDNYMSFDFPDADYRESIFRSLVFLVTMFSMYYGLKLFQAFSKNRFVVSPKWSPLLLASVLVVCTVVVLSSAFVNIPFFKEVIFNLSQKGAVFGGTFAFFAWYRNRTSLISLMLFIVIFALAALFCMKISPGRRLLLTLIAGPPFVSYWLKWRYLRPKKVLVLCCFGVSFIVLGGMAYQLVRHFDSRAGAFKQQERTYANIWKNLSVVSWEGIKEQFGGWKHTLAQSNFEYGLLTKRVVDEGVADVHTLNTAKFVVSYAIPRSMWPGKPRPIAQILPREHLKVPQHATWGVSVAGHSYYEGDYLALVVYAAILVLIVRLIDEPLRREPSNPFFIGTFTASFAYLINTLRGDMGTHFVESLECILFALILNWVARLWCGTGRMAYEPPGSLAFMAGRPLTVRYR